MTFSVRVLLKTGQMMTVPVEADDFGAAANKVLDSLEGQGEVVQVYVERTFSDS